MVDTVVRTPHFELVLECAHLYGRWHYPSRQPDPVRVMVRKQVSLPYLENGSITSELKACS